jgi:hypothetical protein
LAKADEGLDQCSQTRKSLDGFGFGGSAAILAKPKMGQLIPKARISSSVDYQWDNLSAYLVASRNLLAFVGKSPFILNRSFCPNNIVVQNQTKGSLWAGAACCY